jgi:hypothetical protein
LSSTPLQASARRSELLIKIAIVAIVSLRIVLAIWAAAWNTRGDFYASLPGTYVKTVNPVLWDSPDMRDAMGYHLDTYYHGPTQYLTLYPIAFLDSYAAIAWALLPVYVVVIALGWLFLHRALRVLAPTERITLPLFASAFLFFPVLQSFIQREFEVVIFTALSFALWQLVRNRTGIAAIAFAYVAWFKYIPLMLLGYLALRGWMKAAAIFIATSIAIVGLTHVAFGLPEFYNNNVPGHAAQVFRVFDYGFYADAAGELRGVGFCTGWFESETTLTNIRHGLCGFSARVPALPPNVIYLLICVAVAVAYLITHARLARQAGISAADEGWRRALELSIIITICSTFFFAHYYYLVALLIPYSVLLIRFMTMKRTAALAAWGVSYFFVSAFVVPTGILSRLSGADVWALYVSGGWFLPGELLLIWLLMREYWRLGTAAEAVPAPLAQALS